MKNKMHLGISLDQSEVNEKTQGEWHKPFNLKNISDLSNSNMSSSSDSFLDSDTGICSSSHLLHVHSQSSPSFTISLMVVNIPLLYK